MDKKYNSESWIDQRIEIRNSPIDGKGMFARESIKKGEKVIIWGGNIMTAEDIRLGKHRKESAVLIDDNIYLTDSIDDGQSLDEFLNHSCDPNLWMEDEVTLVARKNILPEEELTIDYTMFAWIDFKGPCNCGSLDCRRNITDNDWKLEKVQNDYKYHFSPFLNERIRKLKLEN